MRFISDRCNGDQPPIVSCSHQLRSCSANQTKARQGTSRKLGAYCSDDLRLIQMISSLILFETVADPIFITLKALILLDSRLVKSEILTGDKCQFMRCGTTRVA